MQPEQSAVPITTSVNDTMGLVYPAYTITFATPDTGTVELDARINIFTNGTMTDDNVTALETVLSGIGAYIAGLDGASEVIVRKAVETVSTLYEHE